MTHQLLLPGTILTLQDNVTSRGGVPLDRVSQWGEISWQETCAGATNRGYARIMLPADARALANALIGNVVRIDQPQPFGAAVPMKSYEFRIAGLDDAVPTPDAPMVTVNCTPIINDFGRVQLRTVNGGVASKRVVFTGTPLAFLTALLLPALADQGITGVVAGTVVTGPALTFSGRNVSVLAVLSWLEEQLTVDAWLDRVDDTTFALNLTQRGAGATSPLAWVGKNVEALDRTQLTDDDRFATVLEPEGLTANGEQDPTHIGQAEWSATARSGGGGRVITLADPLGADGPIGVDGDVDGLRAVYALDPLHLPVAHGPLASGVPTGRSPYLAFDPTRRVLWGIGQDETVWWRSVVDDAIAGSLALGAGATTLVGIAYEATNDRIVVACGDVAKVCLINAGTHAVASTITMAANPAALSVVTSAAGSLHHAFVAYLAAASQNIEIINVSTAAVVGTLTGTVGYGGDGGGPVHSFRALYAAAGSHLFVFRGPRASGGGPSVYAWFNPSTFAAIGNDTAGTFSGVICVDETQTALLVVGIDDAFLPALSTIDPSSGAWSDWTPFPTPPAPIDSVFPQWRPVEVFLRFGRYYVVTAQHLFAWDPTAGAWIGTASDVGRGGETPSSNYVFFVGAALELGPSSSENAVVYTADIGAIRRHALTPGDGGAGGADDRDPASPYETFAIAASSASGQTITAPASGSGGPVEIPVEADVAGLGALVEIREDRDFSYRTQLRDPAAIAIYGEVDASPAYGVLAKTNYWRGSTFASDVWRPDDTNRWSSLIIDATAPAMATRWRAADQTGFRFRAVTLTADMNDLDTSVSLTGLNNGTVLSPGDILTGRADFIPGGPCYPIFVRQRAVADSGGNVTVDVTPISLTTAGPIVTGTTFHLTAPLVSLPDRQTDCLVVYGGRIGGSDPGVEPRLGVTVPVPRVLGDSVAWVVAHLKIACYDVSPNKVQLSVKSPFGGSVATITPEDSVYLQSGELRNYWLALRVDLGAASVVSHGFVRAIIESLTETLIQRVAIYVQSLAVVLAAESTNPLDLYGGDGPRILTQLGHARLAAGNSPTQNYQLRVIDGDGSWEVGATAELRDPLRGISVKGAATRIIAVTQYGVPPNTALRRPDVEIGHAPLANFASSIADTAAAAATPDIATAILPSSTDRGGALGTGGVGTPPTPPPVDYIPILAHNALDEWYDAGLNLNDTHFSVQSSGGRGGTKPCLQVIATNATWRHNNYFPSTSATTKLGIGHLWDLNGVTLTNAIVPFYTFWAENDSHILLAVESSTHLLKAFVIDYDNGVYNGTGYDYTATLLGTSATPLPNTGLFHLYASAKPHATTGYVKAWLNGTQILNLTNKDTLGSTFAGVSSNAHLYNVSLLYSTLFGVGDTINGAIFPVVNGIRFAEGQLYDTSALTSDDDFPGQPYTDNRRPISDSATYTSGTAHGAANKWDCDDDLMTTYPSNLQTQWATDYIEMAADGDRYTAGFSTLSASKILFVTAAYVYRHSQSTGTKAMNVSIFSGGTLLDDSRKVIVGTFYGSNGMMYESGPPNPVVFPINTDPHTAATWLPAALNAAEFGFKQGAATTGNNASALLRVTRALIPVTYRP